MHELRIRFWTCLAVGVLLTALSMVDTSLSTWIWLVAVAVLGYAVWLSFRLDR